MIDSKVDKDLVNPLKEGLELCRPVFWVVFVLAFCINLLMLITPLYSLQVLDRVVGSGNLSTLLMLSLIIGSVYFVYGLLQVTRSFTLIKLGEWLDNNVSHKVFAQSVATAAIRPSMSSGQLLRDFNSVKSFMTSVGINTLLDMPWTVAYIAVIFIINKYIGFLTIIGGVILVTLAFFNAIATNKKLGEATEHSIKAINHAEIAGRNAEVVEAMGMMKNVSRNWHNFNKASLASQSYASYRNGIIANISRFFRNGMQMMVTAIGAYFVVTTRMEAMTTGGMIASSILVGKALAPFDNFIEVWKNISSTMKSYKRIEAFFKQVSLREDAMPLPDIKGFLDIENVSYAFQTSAPGGMFALPKYVVKDINFSLEPGQVLAIIGHSAAGKSTLAKVIVGIWKASSGTVRLDGGEVYRWNRENFGKSVGYLPQGIELFHGSIKENIARLEENPSPEKVVEAAKMAGAHNMILGLQDGYDSDIGISGSNLSGGQKQRVGLARAFYGSPKLVVLDEPNANLDEEGERALENALLEAKEKKISVIVISHRTSVLSVADKVLIMEKGQMLDYGDKKDILNHKHLSLKKDSIMHID